MALSTFSNKKQNKLQQNIAASPSWCKNASGWLQYIFLFGTENEEDQLKKMPKIDTLDALDDEQTLSTL